jgi:hypothetical protein
MALEVEHLLAEMAQGRMESMHLLQVKQYTDNESKLHKTYLVLLGSAIRQREAARRQNIRTAAQAAKRSLLTDAERRSCNRPGSRPLLRSKSNKRMFCPCATDCSGAHSAESASCRDIRPSPPGWQLTGGRGTGGA